MSEEAGRKFQTYLFFLRHFDRAIREGRAGDTADALVNVLVNEQHALLTGVVAPAITLATTAAVREMLFNAWNSETVARVNSLFDLDVRAITNQWKPIQTYYALYFLLAAVHEVHAPGHKQGHEPTLRFATNSIGQRFPPPWCCYHDFDASTCHRFAWQHAPSVASGWNLANHDDPFVFIVHFYRTTGQEKRYERGWSTARRRSTSPDTRRRGRRSSSRT